MELCFSHQIPSILTWKPIYDFYPLYIPLNKIFIISRNIIIIFIKLSDGPSIFDFWLFFHPIFVDRKSHLTRRFSGLKVSNHKTL